MGILARLIKHAWVPRLIPFTFLLSLSLPLCAEPLPATISLPAVRWAPGHPEFSLSDSLTLDFTSDEPIESLEARVFEGRQSELIAQAKSSHPGVCRPYTSFKLYVTSTAGTVTFNFRFLPYSIYDAIADAVHDTYYTIVIEKPRGPRNFKLSAEKAEEYFLAGKEIKVRAPAHPAEAVQSGREAYNQERDAAHYAPSEVQFVSVVERIEPRGTCVVILTKGNPFAANRPCSDQPSVHRTDPSPVGQ